MVEDINRLNIRICNKYFGEIANTKEQVFLGPERPGWHGDPKDRYVDVALITLRAEVRRLIIETVGPTLRDISVADDASVIDTDLVIVMAYPSAMIRPESQGTTDINYLSYITSVKGRDNRGLIEMAWDEGTIVPNGQSLPSYFGARPGQIVDMPEPFGISGGGVWRWRGPKSKSEILAPSIHLQLIAVPSDWTSRTRSEFAEPVDLWKTWLSDLLANN